MENSDFQKVFLMFLKASQFAQVEKERFVSSQKKHSYLGSQSYNPGFIKLSVKS